MEIIRYASKELVDKLKAREIGLEEFINECYIYSLSPGYKYDGIDKQVKITIEEE
jgi:hypothetical protein